MLLLAVLDCRRPTNLMMVAAEPKLLQGPFPPPRRLSRDCFANLNMTSYIQFALIDSKRKEITKPRPFSLTLLDTQVF